MYLSLHHFLLSQPPVAPSSTSESRREDFREGLRKLMKNKSIILLVFAYAISQGVQEAILPVLNLDIRPVGIPEVMGSITFNQDYYSICTKTIVTFVFKGGLSKNA